MITKEIKSKILDRFDNKEEKILVSNILDKAYRYEKLEKVEVTQFLNLNEYTIISQILDYLKVKYYTYISNEYADKKIIFFVPEYITVDTKFYSNYISCIKATMSVFNTIKKIGHKDYMGSIYNLGIKSENIGDIFVKGNSCYFIVLNQVKEYILQNLTYVGRNKVLLDEITLDNKELTEFKVNIVDKDYVVPSLRVDAICSSVFNLSRSQIKDKIVKGDLCINDRIVYSSSEVIKIGDIISFRKCGRIIVKEEIKTTKSGNTLLKIGKFN